ncbi:MAG TPA: DUF1631 family protein [Burkholderiaceae bacterium]
MDEESFDRMLQGTESPASSRRRAQYRSLLEDCWTPIRTVFESKLQGALVETLGSLAKAPDEAETKRVKPVLARDRAFVQAYLEALHPELIASIGAFVAARGSEAGKARMLSLVEHADSEFDAAIDQCAARLRNTVDDEFAAVKLRLINLLQEPELRDSELPFRLAPFVRAVAGALRQVGVAEPDVIPLMRVVSSGFGRVLAQAYVLIEQRLAQGGASDAAPVWQATVVGTHGAGRGRGAGAGGGAGAGSLDDAQSRSVLLTLLERMQPGAAPGGGHSAAPGLASATGGGSAPTAAVDRGPTAERSPGAAWTFDPALLSAINDALRATASIAQVAAGAGAGPAVAAEVRQGLIDAASRKLDKLTIELVGLLFDRIQRDRHVPDPIKEQLVRLQFPLLKVALGDPELFAESRQPARRLLDRIASTSIGWSAGGEDNRRYFDQVRTAIDSVTDSTGDASKAFEQALEQFDQFLNEERTRDDDPVARARRALAEAENREILAIKATMQVRSAFDGVQLESYLRDFLLDVWVRVLVEASTHEKTAPGLVRRYLDAIPELVWSVQPKINPGDRKRMIGTIPNVLSVLREGLGRIDWPMDRIQQFFGRLMGSHANAVKALELAHGSLPQFTPSTVRIKLDGFHIPTDTSDVTPEQLKVSDDVVRHALAASAAGVTHLSAPPEAEVAMAMDQQEALNAIAGWSRGLWFDLRMSDGQTERVVLRWISPKKALYLFTTAAGDRAHSLSPDTSVAYLQSGWLVAVEQAPLFDRLVGEVMMDLKHATEKAKGVAG